MITPLAPLPGTAPSLQDEVREAEAGRLRTVERENRELRGLLQVLQEQLASQVGPSSILIPAGYHPEPYPNAPYTVSLSYVLSTLCWRSRARTPCWLCSMGLPQLPRPQITTSKTGLVRGEMKALNPWTRLPQRQTLTSQDHLSVPRSLIHTRRTWRVLLR